MAVARDLVNGEERHTHPGSVARMAQGLTPRAARGRMNGNAALAFASSTLGGRRLQDAITF